MAQIAVAESLKAIGRQSPPAMMSGLYSKMPDIYIDIVTSFEEGLQKFGRKLE